MANWLATPSDDGFSAYQMGALECECPHPPNTSEAIMWKKGWRSAEEKLGNAKSLDWTGFRGRG